jgi:hypothetical protein
MNRLIHWLMKALGMSMGPIGGPGQLREMNDN